MRRQDGFSLLQGTFWLVLVAAGAWLAMLLLPPWSTYWKVQDAFESMARNMAHAQEAEIRERLPEVFRIKYIGKEDVPQAFYDNLKIEADGDHVAISSNYTVTVWLLGRPAHVDPHRAQAVAVAQGMDRLRLKGRIQLDFSPQATTP